MRTPKYSSSIWGKLRSLRLCSDYAPRNGGMAAWTGCSTGITGFRLTMMRLLLVMVVSLYASAAAGPKLSALVIDGMNNHDWAAGTRAIQSILEGSGRFTVSVCTWPAKPNFSHYDVVIDNFNGGHTAAVEVVDHHIVVAEVRLRGPRADADRETSRTFQDALDGAGAGRPIVIVHAVDHQRRELGSGGGRSVE